MMIMTSTIDSCMTAERICDAYMMSAVRSGPVTASSTCSLHRLPGDDRREQEDEQESEPDTELHGGRVDRHDALGEGEVLANVLGGRFELLLFKVFAHEGLDDADALDVLADGAVHVVVLVEDALEDGVSLEDDEHEHRGEQRHERQKDEGNGDVDRKGHDEREDKHERAADRHADDHHVRHLHVGHVRRLTVTSEEVEKRSMFAKE